MDTRMSYYKNNQAKIPSITGKVVPEAVFSKRQYINTIYERIKSDIAPYDPGNILNPIWVNSRGAIPRFDRGSIEIRIMDIQECPPADIAIQTLVIETIKALVTEQFCNLEQQMRTKTEILAGILDDTSESGQRAEILSSEYPGVFGMEAPCTALALWQYIVKSLVDNKNPVLEQWEPELFVILSEGTLSDRILRSMNGDYSMESIRETYKHLADCLAQNKMFIV